MRLIEGETELPLGLDIVRKRDIRVRFGSIQLMVGRGELEMMTFNEKHRLVFHLVPTACDYAKLGGYFGKLQKSQVEALQLQGDVGGHLGVREATKNQKSKVGKQN